MDSFLHKLINEGRLLQVTAADFNGKDFDGAPIVQVKSLNPETQPAVAWGDLIPLIEHVSARGGTDYAWFGIKDDCFNITWAGPGDFLYRPLGNDKKLLVIPGDFLKDQLKELGYES